MGCLWGEKKPEHHLVKIRQMRWPQRPRQQAPCWQPSVRGLDQLGRNADPLLSAPICPFHSGHPCSAKIRSRSMKHIPAPLNQCHVYSFALKKKEEANQLQASSRIPRNRTALSFIVRGRIIAFAATMNDSDGLVILFERSVLRLSSPASLL